MTKISAFYLKYFFALTLSVGLVVFGAASTQVNAQANPNNPGEFKIKVNIEIKPCFLDVTTKPEKRWLKAEGANNFDTQAVFEIFSLGGVKVGEVLAGSNEKGEVRLDLCKMNKGADFQPGIYNLKIKGYSHIKKEFRNVVIFQDLNYNLVFIGDLQQLLAGDTNVDNTVNAYDLEDEKDNFYTSQLRQDFNRDGIVNTLDLGNLIDNFQLTGD